MKDKRFVCVIDQQGGKAGNHWSREDVSPCFTKGRASIADIHDVCLITDEKTKDFGKETLTFSSMKASGISHECKGWSLVS